MFFDRTTQEKVEASHPEVGNAVSKGLAAGLSLNTIVMFLLQYGLPALVAFLNRLNPTPPAPAPTANAVPVTSSPPGAK